MLLMLNTERSSVQFVFLLLSPQGAGTFTREPVLSIALLRPRERVNWSAHAQSSVHRAIFRRALGRANKNILASSLRICAHSSRARERTTMGDWDSAWMLHEPTLNELCHQWDEITITSSDLHQKRGAIVFIRKELFQRGKTLRKRSKKKLFLIVQ